MAEERRTVEDSKDISFFLDEGNTEEPEKQTFRLCQVDLSNDEWRLGVKKEAGSLVAGSTLGLPVE